MIDELLILLKLFRASLEMYILKLFQSIYPSPVRLLLSLFDALFGAARTTNCYRFSFRVRRDESARE